MTSAKNIINFQFTILLHIVKERWSRPWSRGRTVAFRKGKVWSIFMDSQMRSVWQRVKEGWSFPWSRTGSQGKELSSFTDSQGKELSTKGWMSTSGWFWTMTRIFLGPSSTKGWVSTSGHGQWPRTVGLPLSADGRTFRPVRHPSGVGWWEVGGEVFFSKLYGQWTVNFSCKFYLGAGRRIYFPFSQWEDPRCLAFILFKFGGREGFFFHFSLFPNVFSRCSL